MSPPIARQVEPKRPARKLKNGNCTLRLGSLRFNMCGQKDWARHDFSKIPNGAPTIEDRFAILITSVVNGGVISPNQFVALGSTNPAKLFGLFPRKGTIAVGSDADIVVWDPNQERTISAKTHHMNVDNSVFEGMTVKGRPRYVFSRGLNVADGDTFTGRKGHGKFVPGDKFYPVTVYSEELWTRKLRSV